ncbi:MAG: hypothetical protein QXZ12_06930 [Thermoplasmata archaeon]
MKNENKIKTEKTKKDDDSYLKDLVPISDELARELYEPISEDKIPLYIECNHCGKISLYKGYPAVPNVSSILCIHCGHTQMGGNKFIPKKQYNEYVKNKKLDEENGAK